MGIFTKEKKINPTESIFTLVFIADPSDKWAKPMDNWLDHSQVIELVIPPRGVGKKYYYIKLPYSEFKNIYHIMDTYDQDVNDNQRYIKLVRKIQDFIKKYASIKPIIQVGNNISVNPFGWKDGYIDLAYIGGLDLEFISFTLDYR